MSRIGKQPIPVPSGVEVKIDGSTVTVKGPKGELTQTFTDVSRIELEDGVIVVTRPDDVAHRAFAARPDPHARRQHGHRRLGGLLEEPRDRRRRLPCRDEGLATSSCSSVSATRSSSSPSRASRSRCRRRPRSPFAASTSSGSARLPRTSASGASRSPTRARAFATRASTSVASSARPPSSTLVAIRPARPVRSRRVVSTWTS